MSPMNALSIIGSCGRTSLRARSIRRFARAADRGRARPALGRQRLAEKQRLGRDGIDPNKTVNAHRLVVVIKGIRSDWNEQHVVKVWVSIAEKQRITVIVEIEVAER